MEGKPLDIEAEIVDLTARRDINDAVQRYMRGQDRLDVALQRSAFHDDAFVDCGVFAGGPDDYVAFAQGALAQMESSHHLIGQVQISLKGDKASGEVYFIAWHRIPDSAAPKDLIVAGRYVDEYARRNGEWRIVKRREISDWARIDPAADSFLAENPLLWLSGRRGEDFSERRDWENAKPRGQINDKVAS